MNVPASTMIAAISAFLAAMSLFVTVWNYQREQLNQKIAAAKWKKEYFSDLLKWSDDSMLLLSESMHTCELDPQRMENNKFFETRHLLRIKISAQIDRGRWFFPNYIVHGVGEHKHQAFRGYRHEVLDGLVDAYRELSALDCKDVAKNRERRSGIENAKRAFTTEIQKVLDPRSRDEEFRKLLGSVAES